MEGLFITTSDIQLIHNCCSKTAQKKMQLIREVLCKKPHQKVTIKEYCDFEGIGMEDFQEKKAELYRINKQAR